MIDFVAIDFETATRDGHSACEMGLCIVENAEIVKTETYLIKPPCFPYFNPWNVKVHGITAQDVCDAPTFEDIWHEAETLMYGNLMIAHNAVFDANVLRSCLQYYGFYKPKLQYLCSIQIAKKSWNYLPKYGLKYLAEHHQITFKHHRAGDDAEACAKIALLGFSKLMITHNDEVKDVLKKNLKDL